MKIDSKHTSLFLRLGLAFVFIYASLAAFFNPTAWIGFVPNIVEILVSKETFLVVHDIVNLTLGLWLLSGKKIFWAATLSAVAFAGIFLANLGAMSLVFRDVGLFMAAVALALLEKE